MLFKSTIIVAAIAAFAALTEAHVSMRSPCPRYGPYAGCSAPPAGQSVDYDITAPIGTDGSIGQPICKRTVPQTKRTVFKAGQNIKTEYQVGAAHGGGHCQWALSYDNGKTWV
ncbi:hypothetical protein BG005_005116, partial [Podila minutissima]